MKNKAIILITLTILLTSFVSAELIIETYSTDFYTGAPANPEICICGELVDEITIINNAPYPQVFNVQTNIEEIPTQQITLGPRQEIKIPILISASCNERPRTREYNVIIRSTTGAEQIIKRNLEIKECQTINTKLFADKNKTNICSPIEYSILLENPSTFTEEYLIGPLKKAEWFNKVGYEVTLRPGQKSIMNFTFIPPCEISGNITNEFRVQAKRSNLQADTKHELYIEPSYEFILFGAHQIKPCRNEIIKIPYNITNKGLINNTYDIQLRNAPRFASLTQKQITIEPEQTKTFYLELKPDNRANQEYKFEIITETRIGKEQAIKEVNLEIENCYEATINIKSPESLTVCQGTQELDVIIKNEGTKTETYKLTTNTPTAVPSKNEITIEPGQQKQIQLIIDSTNFDRKILFTLFANSTRDIQINWEDSITLDITPIEKCAKIKFPWRYNVYSRYYEDEVKIRVRNIGIQGETYTIHYHGDDFLELKENKTFIDKGEDYEVTLIKTKEHEQDQYYIAIKLVTSQGQEYEKEFRVVLTDTPFLEKFVEYTKQNNCFLTALIIIAIIIIFLLLTITIGSFLNENLKIIISITILIIIFVTLFIYGVPRVNPSLEQPEDPYSFRIYEDKELKINLKEYITDPDGDPLRFTVFDEPEHASLELINETAKIKPSNFTGNDRFKIMADDQRGGYVVTPRFNVEIVPKKKLTALKLYEFYCIQINTLLLAILLILILITKTSKTKEKTQTKKTQNKPSKKKPGRPKKKK